MQKTKKSYNIVETFDSFVSQSKAFGYQSCDVRFAAIHTKNATDYSLLVFLGFLSRETASNTVEKVAGCDLENDRKAKLFQVSYSLAEMRVLLQSIDSQSITLPHCSPPHNKITHCLDLEDVKPVTYNSADGRTEGPINFLPEPGYGLSIFELFDVTKKNLADISASDLDRIDRMLGRHVEFSVVNHSSRIGNLLLAANYEPIRVTFKGDKDGDGIRVMLVSQLNQPFDGKDYILTVTSEQAGEITGSAVLHPCSKSNHIPGIHPRSEIDVRLWQISSSSLIAQNFGRLFGGEVHTEVSTSQHLRTAVLRDKDGQELKRETVSTLVPMNGRLTRKPKWSDAIQEQIQSARKKQLVRDKKLIQFFNGEHERALNEIIGIVNTVSDDSTLKIWDPYVGEFYLDFLTFMNKERPIQVISGLELPPTDSSTDKSVLKTKLKGYLDELRELKVPIEFRYKGNKGFGFHDRFIIGGGRCWSLGSSLNHIGDKHCLILDVPYPEIIESEFDRLWKLLEGNVL